MLTLKIHGAECTSWIPDVTEVNVWKDGVTIPGPHEDVVKILTEAHPHLKADVIWHVTGRADNEPWYAVVVQAKYGGCWHHHVVQQGEAYLLGPDGKTIDRIY